MFETLAMACQVIGQADARSNPMSANPELGGRISARVEPLLLTPITLRGLTARNRIVVSPMSQYAAIDGAPPKRVVVLAFDSLEQAQAGFASPAYVEARKIGEKYATFRTFVVEGLAK